jgi:ribosome-associated protein
VKKAKRSPKSTRHRKHTRPAAAAKQQAARREGARPREPGVRSLRPATPSAPGPAKQRERREALAFAKTAIAAALEKKAIQPVLIDVTGRSSYADFIAVLSGRSDRQVEAIAEGVCEAMAAAGRKPLGREGARNGRWVLIDFGDIVLHVFYHPLREIFDIESLWVDAPRVKLQVPAEARADGAPGRDGAS